LKDGIKALLKEKIFGSACNEVVIEERLYGHEVSGNRVDILNGISLSS
jgi:phosphoribosylamine-glycine ligase